MHEKLLEIFQKNRAVYQNEPDDKKLVYDAAKKIDELLEQILLKHLLKSPDDEKDNLLDGGKALSSLGAKISMTQRLGLISEGLALELRALRRIKKQIKNTLDFKDLEQSEIRDLCQNLKAPARVKTQRYWIEVNFPETPRGNFELTAVISMSLLENILDQTQETDNTPVH